MYFSEGLNIKTTVFQSIQKESKTVFEPTVNRLKGLNQHSPEKRDSILRKLFSENSIHPHEFVYLNIQTSMLTSKIPSKSIIT